MDPSHHSRSYHFARMTEIEFITRWKAEREMYASWGKYVTQTIRDGLAASNLPKSVDDFIKIPPSPRVKTDISLLEKAFYRDKPYKEPYREITDKVGVRFVVLLERDIEIVSKVVEQSPFWTPSRDRDFDLERGKHPEVFGYQSVHYVVTAKADITCDEGTVPAGTPCEVQIRTLLQHAHSELTHDTIYKPKTNASSLTKRYCSRSMALIETVDDFFVRVMAQIEKAGEPLRLAMESLASTFKETVGLAPEPSNLNTLMLDAYSDRLSEVGEGKVLAFLQSKPFIAKLISERASARLLFRQPAVLLMYYLADVAPRDTKSRWPLTPSELQPIYEDLGQKF